MSARMSEIKMVG